MKKKIFLSMTTLVVMALLSFANSAEVRAQSDCCTKTSSASCCETKSSCCETTNGTSQGVSPDSAVCLVSGESLESGKGVGFKYLGTEYKFCCPGCLESFKAEPMDYIKDIQCPVMGSASKKDVSATVDGVKYYFCCKGCDDKFMSNPEQYLNGHSGSEHKHKNRGKDHQEDDDHHKSDN